MCVLRFTCLNSRADCFQCWNELCSGTASNDMSFENRCCSPCGKASNNCRDLTGALNSQTCCDDAEENILLLFPRESNNQGRTEACNSSRVYFGELEPNSVFFEEDTLPSGMYIMPYFIFNCSGCIEEVLVRGLDSNKVEKLTIDLQFWAQHGEPEDKIYKMMHNATIYTNQIHTPPDAQNIHNAMFKLLSGEACFEEGEILGFSSSGNFRVKVTRSASIYSETNITVYRVNNPSGNNCSNLEDYAYTSSLERLQDSRIAVIDLKISKCTVNISNCCFNCYICYILTLQRNQYHLHHPHLCSLVQACFQQLQEAEILLVHLWLFHLDNQLRYSP